jgi:hypothetical protein
MITPVRWRVVLRILESPPESLSLLLGDALQNLHSALDHEVHRQSVARMAAPSHRPWPGKSVSGSARRPSRTYSRRCLPHRTGSGRLGGT